MQFEPKTQQQLLDERLMAGKDYDATVAEATDTRSKAGNDMIAVRLNVYRPDGGVTQLPDWLLPSMGLKLLFFCESAGIKDKYDAGSVTADDCINRDVRVRLGSQKDPNGVYPDKLVIKDYIPKEMGTVKVDRAPARNATPVRDALAAAFDPNDL